MDKNYYLMMRGYLKEYIQNDVYVDNISQLLSVELLSELVGFKLDEEYIKIASDRINSINADEYSNYLKNKKSKFKGKWEFLVI